MTSNLLSRASSGLQSLTRDGRRRRLRTATALATAVLGMGLVPALASAETVPTGGDFESTPLVWSTSGSAGSLSTISAAQAQDADNRYVRTTYAALAGLSLAGLAAQETITSPTFTWSQPTPQAITVSLDHRASLGALVGIDGGVTLSAHLYNVATQTSTPLLSTTITTSSTTFQTLTAAASPALLSQGGQYQLVVSENVSPLLLVAGQATIDLDNVFLDVTPATAPAPVLTAGSAAISQVTSTGAVADATIDPGSTDTTVSVDYGTTTSDDSQVNETLTANSGPTAVSEPISGLTASTTYHARIVATSTAGTATSPDLTFTTSTQPSGVSQPTTNLPSPGATPAGSDTTASAGAPTTTTMSGAGSSTTPPATVRPTASAGSTPRPGATCVAAHVSAPARTLRRLALPASAQVTASHALRLAPARTRWGAVRYRLASGPTSRASRRGVVLGLGQLRIGHTTPVTIVLPRSGHRAATRLRLSISALPCGARATGRVSVGTQS